FIHESPRTVFVGFSSFAVVQAARLHGRPESLPLHQYDLTVDGQESTMSAAGLTKLTQCIISCRKCPRLVRWREQVAREKRAAFRDEEYWGRPVPGFGDPK